MCRFPLTLSPFKILRLPTRGKELGGIAPNPPNSFPLATHQFRANCMGHPSKMRKRRTHFGHIFQYAKTFQTEGSQKGVSSIDNAASIVQVT